MLFRSRDLALRFNHRYGPVFTVPEIALPTEGARIMDLAEPTSKMAKSSTGPGIVRLLDGPDVVRRTIARAVTDSEVGPDAVRPDREQKPGVTNLLEILAACGGEATGITTYGALKRAVTDAVVAVLEPVQARYAELAEAPEIVRTRLEEGEARCREVTAPVLAAAMEAIGL